eukprot:54481_1
MDEEFDYMVTPLVFNLNLLLKSEGNSCTIDNVYGCNEQQLDLIINNGQIQNIKTLFPSKKNKGKGGTKGGIILILLKLPKNKNDNNNMVNVEMSVGYEDRNGNEYKSNQFITLNEIKQKNNNDIEGKENNNNNEQNNMMDDMIENDNKYEEY